jgi:hypothetical protein
LFNQPIDNLPTGLKELIFGSSFDRTIDNLPIGLKELIYLVVVLISELIIYHKD